MNITDLYKNLIIFDSKGNPISKTTNVGGYFESHINMEKHSVFLPEHMTIYVMEKFKNSDGVVSIKSVTHDDFIGFDVDGDGFFIYEADNNNIISKELFKTIQKNINTKILDSDGFDNYQSEINTPITINLAHIYEEENIFNGSLKIFIGDKLLWVIDLYTETEDEDERYIELLSNIGEEITHRHENIFRHSDINEGLSNSMLLNEKRKEFLTVINDITPYISSVRGILQIIDFFDYKNVVEVKEYWYNPFEDKVRIVPITEVYKDIGDVKLQQFGLFYKINEPTDNIGVDGLPILKENFLISNEEIIIKLFALKEYFIEKDYGGISDIVDIIGEIYNYQMITIRHWRTNSVTSVYDSIPTAKFDIKDVDYYIEPIEKEYDEFLESYMNLEDIGAYKIFEIGKHRFTHFKGYLDSSTKINDDGNIEIGARVKIVDKTFKNKIKDLTYSWNAISAVDIYWYNAHAPNFYDIRYIINRNMDNVVEDGRTYNATYNGSLAEMSDIDIVLPYDGYYDVTMILTGYDGIVTSSYVKKAIEVKLRDPNFMFFFKIHDKSLQSFDSNNFTWSDINQEFNQPISYNNNLHSVADISSPIFTSIDFWKIGGRALNPTFRSSKFAFKRYSLITWADASYHGDTNQTFVMSGIVKGSMFQVDESIMVSPDINVNEYKFMEKFMTEKLTDTFRYEHYDRLSHSLIKGSHNHKGYDGDIFVGSSEDNIISKDKMQTWSDFNHTFQSCPLLIKNTGSAVKLKYKPNSLTSANTKVFYNEVDAPSIVPIFISLDNANVYGKTNAKWKIKKNGKIIHSASGLLTVHQFKDYGTYDVSLEVLDKNNNVYKLEKSNVINIVNDFDYLKNYRYATR